MVVVVVVVCPLSTVGSEILSSKDEFSSGPWPDSWLFGSYTVVSYSFIQFHKGVYTNRWF